MVLTDIHFIHGESLVKRPKLELPTPLQIEPELLDTCGSSAKVSLFSQLSGAVLICQTKSSIQRLDLNQKRVLGTVNEQQAKAIALENLATPADIVDISLFEVNPPSEISPRHLPFWRVEFDTADSATLYISAQSGEIVTKRHTFWRLFDWMWRFHIMDYDDGENVKNGLLTAFLSLSLVTTIAGLVLLVRRLRTKTQVSRPWFVKWHGLIAAVVGCQFVVWLLTGAFFNLVNSPDYSPNLNRQSVDNSVDLSAFSNLKTPEVSSAQRITLTNILGRAHWVIEQDSSWHSYQKKIVELRQVDSNRIVELDRNMAQKIAMASYKGAGEVTDVKFINESGSDYLQQQNGYWRIEIADEELTWIFVDSQTGEVLKHSNQGSRFKDLMLKLHFMDYFNQGGFNHALMYLFALLAMAQALTGIIWTLKLAKAGQFKLTPSTKSSEVTVQINRLKPNAMNLSNEVNLYSALKAQGIVLPSSCDGAGTCGHCVSKISPALSPTEADIQLICKDKLAQGYRLACQHACAQIASCAVKSVKPCN